MAKYFLRLGDREVEAELEETPAGPRVQIDGVWKPASLLRVGNSPRYVLALDDRVLEVLVEDGAQGFSLHIEGRSYEIETAKNRTRKAAQESEQFVDGAWVMRAPLTGVVTELRIGLGEAVTSGQILFVVEAMKMLNELRARVDGVVTTLGVAQGARVELGDLLITVEPTEPESGASS